LSHARSVTENAHFAENGSGLTLNRHKRPIGAHFRSGGVEFSYLGQDLEEALGEPEEPIASTTEWERATEHLHCMLSGD
jgi:hypothetical protein